MTRFARSSPRRRSTSRRSWSRNRPLFAVRLRSFPRFVAALTLTTFLFPFGNNDGFTYASHTPRLVISEVHPNAAINGSSAESNEWVEIHNLKHHAVNLNGWTIEDAQAIARLPDVDLAPGETALIVGSAADIAVPAGKTLIILERSRIGTGLRNAGDRVALINPQGVRHDAVSWGDVRSPRSSEPPTPQQSIVRTASGGQSLTAQLTPWTVGETLNATPERHQHPQPDTAVRFLSALIDPLPGDAETVTIRNTSNEPVLTVNWTLTVNNSLAKLRSVRIEPGASHVIQEADGTIGGGLSRRGGHLVLRDSKGNWLSTASWGDDHTFHRLTPPVSGQELRFNPLTRVHPRTPWFEELGSGNGRILSSVFEPESPQPTNAAANITRERPESPTQQESEEAAVWISEVYPNAGQGRNDPLFEWFELTNSTGATIELDGWSVADNTSSDPLDGVTIGPNTSIVIAASAEANPRVVVAISDGRIGNGLANSGDQLRLIDPAGRVVSAISWGDDNSHNTVRASGPDESIHRAAPADPPVVARPSAGTLTLFSSPAPPANQSESSGTQAASTATAQGATDAAETEPPSAAAVAESVPTLRITEILPAPLAGQAEWVEIHNPTDQPIDLSGWTIGDAERRTELAGTIGPGSRFVISTRELDAKTVGLIVDRIGNGLNNDADTVSVFAPDGTLVHEVRYGSDRLPAPERGLSIALEPERWVVTAQPSPGSADVTPLLGNAFRSASIKPPIADEDRLPIVQAKEQGGVNAWMIVSFALIGVVLTLVIRRVRPEETPLEPRPEPTNYTGPTAASSPGQMIERQRESEGE
ncbi:MAG: lamin tail domain-containing protein [Chloroflexota bacterium]|nr:lamin tail domain-containing protein [Chloroflexota bacterium]